MYRPEASECLFIHRFRAGNLGKQGVPLEEVGYDPTGYVDTKRSLRNLFTFIPTGTCAWFGSIVALAILNWSNVRAFTKPFSKACELL